jgi:hypothetical protein
MPHLRLDSSTMRSLLFVRVIEYNESCVEKLLQAPKNAHNMKENMSSCIKCVSVNWGIESWYALMSNKDLYLSWLFESKDKIEWCGL